MQLLMGKPNQMSVRLSQMTENIIDYIGNVNTVFQIYFS